jgi:hypothetical protein
MNERPRRIVSVLKDGLRSLLKRSRGRPSETIEFPSDAQLIGALRPAGGAIGSAIDCLARGEASSARRFVAQHFRERAAPRTFFDRTRVKSMLESIESHHPEWRQASLEFAAAWCSQLGEIYGATICCNGTIDWDRLAAGPGNDHLYRDRLHHFAFAPLLARAALYGAAVEDDLLVTLRAWVESTARSRRPDAYSGSLIVAYRIVALAWAHAFLAAKAGDPDLEFEILRILRSDVGFIVRRLGTSFPNNHLLADGFVTWFAGMAYPEFADAGSWIERGDQIWLRELRRQIYEDGSSFEHASHYHTMACEMVASYTILNRLNHRAYPEWVDTRMHAMLRLHEDMAGPHGEPFEYGDGVEDPLIPVGDLHHWGRPDYSGLLGSTFDEESRSVACRDDQGVFWLAGGALPATTSKEERAAMRCYPQGGLYLFEDADSGTRLLFRTGPVDGLPVNPGHMHADLLSILVHVSGAPMIVDAGTYTYRSNRDAWPAGSPRGRHYFMSAVAHNGMSISGEDPLGRGSGDFPGASIHSRTAIGASMPGSVLAWVEAENRGDTAYAGHRRGVVQVRGHYHLIYDVPGRAASLAAVSFGLQFAAGTRLEQVGRSGLVVARGTDAALCVATSDNLLVDTIACGQESPPLGWVSPRYGDLQPAPMLRYKPRSDEGPFVTFLSTGDAKASVEALALGRGAHAFRVTTDRYVDHVLASTGDATEEIAAWGIRFVGKLLWLRTIEGLPRELRWLQGRGAAWPSHGVDLRADEPVGELVVQVSPSGSLIEGCSRERLSAEWFGEPMP